MESASCDSARTCERQKPQMSVTRSGVESIFVRIELKNLTWPMIEAASDASLVIEVRGPGTGRDGGPTCGTVKQFSGC